MMTYTANKLVDEAMARETGSGAISEREAKTRTVTDEVSARGKPGAALWKRSECKKRQAPELCFGKKEEWQ